MPDNFIDLTVTSPPYDNLRNYNGYSFDFEAISLELFRVTKVGGVVVWVVGDATIDGSETGTSFIQALQFKNICGFRLHDTMIYKKHSIPQNSNRYEQHFEYMFVFSKDMPKVVNLIKEKSLTSGTYRNRNNGKGDKSAQQQRDIKTLVSEFKIKGNVWEYDIGKNDITEHPAVFPEKLARDHIYSWSNEGDLVYDPFMGSGTTAKMAHLQKRNWIGSEISQEYVDLANKRIDPYLKQLTIF
jgi:site-specific DNA-methyltransferase (adenine-specific)